MDDEELLTWYFSQDGATAHTNKRNTYLNIFENVQYITKFVSPYK